MWSIVYIETGEVLYQNNDLERVMEFAHLIKRINPECNIWVF